MKVVSKLQEIIDNPNHTEKDLKEFVGKLSEEEWSYLVKELPKNPFLGKLGRLREEYLTEQR